MRYIAMFLSLLFVLAASQHAKAEDMTLEKAMKAWAFLDGDWNLINPEQDVAAISIKMAPNQACYVLSGQKVHGVFTFDASAKKMLIFTSHEGGAVSNGHWMPTGEGIVEGKFTMITADGEKAQHMGKFELVNKDHIKYTIDENVVYNFKRR